MQLVGEKEHRETELEVALRKTAQAEAALEAWRERAETAEVTLTLLTEVCTNFAAVKNGRMAEVGG